MWIDRERGKHAHIPEVSGELRALTLHDVVPAGLEIPSAADERVPA